MTLEEKIITDLKTAMKAKDQVGLRGIRAIKAALILAKTDGSGQTLDENAEIKLLQNLVKQRQDSLNIYTQQGREDLAATEQEEIEVISRYLPAAMTETELEATIQKVITDTGASSVKDMGKVMGAATAAVAGRADGKTISAMVKKLLA